jgi:hypothetical protein
LRSRIAIPPIHKNVPANMARSVLKGRSVLTPIMDSFSFSFSDFELSE